MVVSYIYIIEYVNKKIICILTYPLFDHVNPVLPIIKELVNCEHQIIVFSNLEYKNIIEQNGAIFYEYKPISSEFGT